MLAKRVIPTVLVRGKTAYKGPGFGAACTRSVGSAMAICRTHASRSVDELLILDIGATPEGRGPDLDLVRELSAECYIPITVGGGVKTIEDIDALLRAGADKVAIGTGTFNFFLDAAKHFGNQALTAIVAYTTAVRWQAHFFADILGQCCGEVVVQSQERDSTMSGYDISIIELASRSRVPIIVSGGCSGPSDMLAAFRAGADACAAGALFQFTDTTPRDCSRFLKANGIEVRL